MNARHSVRKLVSITIATSLVACSAPARKSETFDLINAELRGAAQTGGKVVQPEAVSDALLPPLKIELPKPAQPVEERFSVSFNNVQAHQFFLAIATGTRYSVLVHPEVTGTISANLKDVTVIEALDAIRELYGYDYKIDGTRIYVKPLTLQTRVFQVNYLTGSRRGTSDIRVTSGSVSDVATPVGGAAPSTTVVTGPNQGPTTAGLNTSKISTSSVSDFWSELKASLDSIVGNREGRSVVVSPQSGVVVVRAMWDEIRNVASYLKATQLSVDRQVILDAKIIEVELNDGFQSGINWAGFRVGGNGKASGGLLTPGTTLSPTVAGTGEATVLSTANSQATGGLPIAALPGSSIAAGTALGGSLFGLAFQTSNFAALISFLETQGSVHVLSSPRIATLNNQKAVLKVGKDEFFVTNVSTTTTATGSTSTTSPSVTVQPFFSGVALDVTPQIGEDGGIILHIHPSVSSVTTVDKPLNLGAAGTFSLPLASSTISETDSVVRGKDGHIVAIGGLMRQASVSDRSQVPGAGDAPGVGGLFRNTKQVTQKRELVILLKPTVIQGESSWVNDVLDSQQRIQHLIPRSLENR